jgi:hypothetical protein
MRGFLIATANTTTIRIRKRQEKIMGEIADMMLDGTMCEMCGTFIGNGDGYPRYCSKACARDRGADWELGKIKSQSQDTISIKITYNGDKILHVKAHDNTFENALDIADYLTKYLEQGLEITPNFKHPKLALKKGKK